ncbi:MAG: MFS transporter [Steroidobacteraceae bacterium]
MFKPGSWPSIGLIYCYGVLGSASLSKIIPLQQDYAAHVGTTPAQFALLISLLTIPPAVFATIGGSLIDRVGARRTLIAAASAGALVNGLYLIAPSLLAFQLIRVLEGCVLVGAYAAAPALIIATAPLERRGPAMAFWSTYTPVGVSLGLALSSVFAGDSFWRGGYAVHAALFALLIVAGFTLPQPVRPAAAPPGGSRSLLAAYSQPGPLRVALTFAALVVMGFGVNTVFPSWYAEARGVTLAAASGLLAGANLVMIAGSLAVSVLLAREVRPHRLFTVLAVGSIVAAALMFIVGASPTFLYAGLALWLLTSGAATAVVAAALPRVVASPAQAAGAAGLLSQMAALATFITPPLWLPMLARGQVRGFVVIVIVAWVLALLLLPKDSGSATA